jgi:hypothetical protein
MTCPVHGTKMVPGPACDPAPACFECYLDTPAPNAPKGPEPKAVRDSHGHMSIRSTEG